MPARRFIVVLTASALLSMTPIRAGDSLRIKTIDRKPTLLVDGAPAPPLGAALVPVWPASANFPALLGQYNRAVEAGIHLHVLEPARRGLPWPDEYVPPDYYYIDQLVDQLLTRDLNAQFLLRIDVTFVPPKWAEENPDHMARNVMGEAAGWPSLASPVWRRDLEREIGLLCDHIEQAPYRDRMAGFILDGLHEGQWRLGPQHPADFSPAGLEAWRTWIGKRYKSDAEMREAWNEPVATRQSAFPPKVVSESDVIRLPSHLLNPGFPADRLSLDSRLHSTELVAETAARIAGWFREKGRGRLVGLNSGGVLEWASAENFGASGQFGMERVLRSGVVDFFTGPVSYAKRGVTESGPTPPAPVQSIESAGRLFFYLDDTRTHLAPLGPLRFAETPEETRQLLWRNFALPFIQGAGYLLADTQGEGWHLDPAIWQGVARMREIGETATRANAGLFEPEAAIVIDEDSMPYLTGSAELAMPLLYEQREDFARAGISHGIYLQSRIEEIPESVRIFFFLNSFAFDRDRETQLHAFLAARKATAVWLFAPGLIGDTGFNAAGASSLTGIDLQFDTALLDHAQDFINPGHPALARLQQAPPPDSPPLGPTVFATLGNPNVTLLSRYQERPVMGGLAVRDMPEGWRSVFCPLPRPGVGIIRGLAELAGAHVWTETMDAVARPGGEFVAVNALRDGAVEIRLPYTPDSVVNLIDGAQTPLTNPGAQRVTLNLNAGEFRLLYARRAAESDASGIMPGSPESQSAPTR